MPTSISKARKFYHGVISDLQPALATSATTTENQLTSVDNPTLLLQKDNFIDSLMIKLHLDRPITINFDVAMTVQKDEDMTKDISFVLKRVVGPLITPLRKSVGRTDETNKSGSLLPKLMKYLIG